MIILADHIHSMVQYLFSNDHVAFQNDSAPIHASRIIEYRFCEHNGDLSHLSWPIQSSGLNIIELYVLLWRERCNTAIHLHHHYLDLLLFCRQNSIWFPWKTYRTCISPYREDLNLFWTPRVFLHWIRHGNRFLGVSVFLSKPFIFQYVYV